ncbi:MAG TPA: HEAT repeat domain-containing protein [Chloroflexota bacterium]|nr:HEAT repeat domain-containing protein [Chloroflexota bacterium]
MDQPNQVGTGTSPTTRPDPALLAELVEALAHESPVVRRHHAARRLTAYGPAAVPAVADALRRGGRAQAAAAYVLWRLDGSRLPALVATLADVLRSSGDDEARSDAAWALGEIGSPAAAAVPALLSALRGEDDARPWVVSPYAPGPATPTLVRMAAATALAAVATPLGPITEGLRRGLASTDVSLRWWAASALAALGPPAGAALDDLATAALNADELWEVRWQAADAAGSVGGAGGAAVPALTRLLGDPDRWVRVGAARALARGGAGAAPAVPALVRALRDPDEHLRRNAVYALAALGGAAAPVVPPLGSLVDDPSVAGFAAEALAAIGPAAVGALSDRLGHRDEGVRRLVARALQVSATPEATAVLAGSGVEPLMPTWSHLWPAEQATDLTDDARRAFDGIVRSARGRGENPLLAWRSPHPKRAFLRYLVEDLLGRQQLGEVGPAVGVRVGPPRGAVPVLRVLVERDQTRSPLVCPDEPILVGDVDAAVGVPAGAGTAGRPAEDDIADRRDADRAVPLADDVGPDERQHLRLARYELDRRRSVLAVANALGRVAHKGEEYRAVARTIRCACPPARPASPVTPLAGTVALCPAPDSAATEVDRRARNGRRRRPGARCPRNGLRGVGTRRRGLRRVA